ncbi:MAG: RNA-binding protein [Elusimicrobia bacterium]|nr:RNA-binding protein [Elusimicrobiota bacterium]
MGIYVGNLSNETTEEELKGVFQEFGEVTSVNIIKDKFTGQSRGFGFVEMASGDSAKAAIAGMNGKELKGRTLTVNEARPKNSGGKRHFGGGGGYGRGGGYGDRGGYGGGGDYSGRRSFGPGGSRKGGGKNRGGGGRKGR